MKPFILPFLGITLLAGATVQAVTFVNYGTV